MTRRTAPDRTQFERQAWNAIMACGTVEQLERLGARIARAKQIFTAAELANLRQAYRIRLDVVGRTARITLQGSTVPDITQGVKG